MHQVTKISQTWTFPSLVHHSHNITYPIFWIAKQLQIAVSGIQCPEIKMEERSPSPMSFDRIPEHNASPVHTIPVTPVPMQNRNPSNMDGEKSLSGIAVTRNRSPPRRDFAVPRSSQSRITKNKMKHKKSSTAMPFGHGSCNNVSPKQRAFILPSSLARGFTPVNVLAHVASSSNSEDTPMDEAPSLCHPKTPETQKPNAVDDAETDDDSPSATEILQQCASEATSSSPSPSKQTAALSRPCYTSSGFTPISGPKHKACASTSEDTPMDESPSICRPKTLETSPPRRSMSSSRKSWRAADWYQFKAELSEGADEAPQMSSFFALQVRKRAVAEVESNFSENPETPTPHNPPGDHNILNNSDDRRFSIISTLSNPSKDSDDNTASRANTNDTTPPKEKPELVASPPYQLTSDPTVSRCDEHIARSRQVQADQSSTQKLQEATLLLSLDVASEKRNGSTASEGNSDLVETTPDTTPPKNSPKASTFPPFEYASYSILCKTLEDRTQAIRQARSDPTAGQTSDEGATMLFPHLSLILLHSPTACKGSSDSMPDASPPGNMVEELPLPEHEGATYNSVISNHKDYTASNHEAAEDVTLPELSESATLPEQTNLPPFGEASNSYRDHRTWTYNHGAPHAGFGPEWYAPVTLPLPQIPYIPTNADLPDNIRWIGRRFKDIQCIFPEELETRRFDELPDGWCGGLRPGPDHLGPRMKPWSNGAPQ